MPALSDMEIGVVSLVGAIAAAIVATLLSRDNKTSPKSATVALTHLLEWSKWISGIETAVIGGMVALIFKADDKAGAGTLVSHLGGDVRYAYALLINMGAALLCSGWILSSLPSQAIRIPHPEESGHKGEEFDIYERPLYGWLPVPLGYMMTLQHWLWALGLIFAGILLTHRILR